MEKTKTKKILWTLITIFVLVGLGVGIYINSITENENSYNADTVLSKAESDQGTVRIKYLDKSGKTLAEDKVITGKVGNWYETTRKEISTYKAFGDEPLNKKGYYTKNETVIKYVYEKISNVTTAVDENDKVTVTVPNDRVSSEYDVWVKANCTNNSESVTGPEITVCKEAEQILKKEVNKSDLFVGTITARDENSTVYSFEVTKGNGYRALYRGKFNVTVNKSWNETQNKYEITLDYDHSIQGAKAEIVNGKIEVTFDYEFIQDNYSMKIVTVDENTQAIVPSTLVVHLINEAVDKDIAIKDDVEDIGDFEMSKNTAEVSYYQVEQVEIANGYTNLFDEPMTIEVRKIFNEAESKYDFDVIYDESIIYVEVVVDDNGVITIIVSCAKNEDRDYGIEYFVSKVNSKEITDRIPKYYYDSDKKANGFTGRTDNFDVRNNDKLNLTARVYNNSDKNRLGTAVKLDIPDGLVFDKENQTNIENNWKMYINGKDGVLEKTDDPQKAEVLVSKSLTRKTIKAFNETTKELDYKDLNVVFIVKEDNLLENRNIIATAELTGFTKDLHEENNKNSEYLNVNYFDLAITKYIENIEINQNGEKLIREVGFDKKDTLTKLEIKSKKINETYLDIKYGINVKNVGEIEGLAIEITDYIPDGLTFDSSKNPDWFVEGNEIKTTVLNNCWLNPGEEKTIYVILTWNLKDNDLGLKTNVAHISQYYNESDAKDLTEDNQSEAPIIVSVATGEIIIAGVVVGLIVILVVSSTIVIRKNGRKED